MLRTPDTGPWRLRLPRLVFAPVAAFALASSTGFFACVRIGPSPCDPDWQPTAVPASPLPCSSAEDRGPCIVVPTDLLVHPEEGSSNPPWGVAAVDAGSSEPVLYIGVHDPSTICERSNGTVECQLGTDGSLEGFDATPSRLAWISSSNQKVREMPLDEAGEIACCGDDCINCNYSTNGAANGCVAVGSNEIFTTCCGPECTASGLEGDCFINRFVPPLGGSGVVPNDSLVASDARGVAVSGDQLYWIEDHRPSKVPELFRLPVADFPEATPQKVADLPQPAGQLGCMAADDRVLVWASETSVFVRSIEQGCTAELVTGISHGNDVAIAGGFVYWTANAGVFRMAIPAP